MRAFTFLIALFVSSCQAPAVLERRIEHDAYTHVYADNHRLYARLYGDYRVDSVLTRIQFEEVRRIVSSFAPGLVDLSPSQVVLLASTDMEPFFTVCVSLLHWRDADTSALLSNGFFPDASSPLKRWELLNLDSSVTAYFSLMTAEPGWILLCGFERVTPGDDRRAIGPLRNEMQRITRTIRHGSNYSPTVRSGE